MATGKTTIQSAPINNPMPSLRIITFFLRSPACERRLTTELSHRKTDMSAPEPNGQTETTNPVGSSELVRCVRISERLKENLAVFRRVHGDKWPEVMADLGTALQLQMKATGEPNDPSSATRPMRRVDWNSSAMAGRCSAWLGRVVWLLSIN